jgi:hypothetical protein
MIEGYYCLNNSILFQTPLSLFLNILVIGIIVGSLSNSLTARRKIMDKKGEFTKNGTPLFDGKYHYFFGIRM